MLDLRILRLEPLNRTTQCSIHGSLASSRKTAYAQHRAPRSAPLHADPKLDIQPPQLQSREHTKQLRPSTTQQLSPAKELEGEYFNATAERSEQFRKALRAQVDAAESQLLDALLSRRYYASQCAVRKVQIEPLGYKTVDIQHLQVDERADEIE
ncbi:hypothetical protein LTR17_016697 [Elasticomyces elasticus]|nr:hypothetical protein LTR17_016697 [Elasticomyces elasticus]